MNSESNKRHLFSKPPHQSPPSIGLGPGYHERERPLYEHNHNPPDFHHSFEKENPYPATESKRGHLQSYPVEYSETYAHGGYEYPVGGHGHGSTAVGHNVGSMMDFQKLKSLLLPLAGLALLGAAAVFTTNPVMLPLGVISGRRRRRHLLEDDKPFIYPADHVVKAYRNFSRIN